MTRRAACQVQSQPSRGLRVDGSERDRVLSAVEADEGLSIDAIRALTGVPRKRVYQILATEGYTRGAEDRHPAGAPATHDALLAALRRVHPPGGGEP